MRHCLIPLALVTLPPFLAAQGAPFDVVAALGRGKVATAAYAAKLAFDYTAALIRVPVQFGERDAACCSTPARR